MSQAGKVLIVEDQTGMRQRLVRCFRDQGWEIKESGDGEDGLKQAKEWAPDVVVLDIFMPKVSGTEMLKEMRETPWGKTIPVLIITNLPLTQEVTDFIEPMGFVKCCEKTKTPLSEVLKLVEELHSR